MKDRTIIVKTVFGSHLYGTNTETSDQDFKGIFLPSKREIILNEIPRSIHENTKPIGINCIKNTKEDIDCEYYSLYHFIKLGCDGETAILDMLFTPEDKIIEKHPMWNEIVKNRHLLITKNVKAFTGYARSQASKYGIKGSRLGEAKKVLLYLEDISKYLDPTKTKLEEVWENLPIGEHIFKHEELNPNGEKIYQVCGRKMGSRASIQYGYEIIKRFANEYGERAKKAENNEGIDWKAISHAFRVAFEVKELLTSGKITFPLQESEFVMNIKLGKFNYNNIAILLDNIIDSVEKLAKTSNLPEKPNREFWKDFIIDNIDKYVLK